MKWSKQFLAHLIKKGHAGFTGMSITDQKLINYFFIIFETEADPSE